MILNFELILITFYKEIKDIKNKLNKNKLIVKKEKEEDCNK